MILSKYYLLIYLIDIDFMIIAWVLLFIKTAFIFTWLLNIDIKHHNLTYKITLFHIFDIQ
jgi:hypothetical protein